MTNVKFENSLAVHDFTLSLVKKISLAIKEIEQWNTKKLDNELTKWVCKYVDAAISDATSSKATKPLTSSQALAINKAAVVIQALKQTFDLTDSEVSIVQSQIDFLIDNGLISSSAVTTISKVISSVKSIIKKVS
jgi:hypothetical protein